ncbi:MAG: extracellular solute-binding protein [Aggregatilineales bacterium]
MKNSKIVILITTMISLLLLFSVNVMAQDQVELTITWWGSQNRHDRTIEVIEQFEAEHPEIDVVFEFSGWADYWTRVNTQAAGGNVACIMQQDYAFLTEWASRDLLLPMDDLFASGAVDVSNVSESILNSGMVNGETYGLSLGTNSQVYILDADAFEAAGVELPAWDWTWEDFETISTQIHDALGIWSIAYGPWDDANMKSVLLSDGQWLFTDDGTAIGIEDSTVWIDHLNRIHRLMESGAIASMEEQADVSAPGLEGSPIVEGTEAIRYQWSNQLVALYTAAGEDRNFVLYPLPRVAGGQSANYLKPSMFFSITEGCETVEEAAMFIDYFTNSLEANDVLFAERGVPVSSVVQAHLAESVDAVTASIFEYIAQVGESASPVPPPDPAGWSDINTNILYPQYVEPVLFGMLDAADGFDFFVEESDLILAQNAQ